MYEYIQNGVKLENLKNVNNFFNLSKITSHNLLISKKYIIVEKIKKKFNEFKKQFCKNVML